TQTLKMPQHALTDNFRHFLTRTNPCATITSQAARYNSIRRVLDGAKGSKIASSVSAHGFSRHGAYRIIPSESTDARDEFGSHFLYVAARIVWKQPFEAALRSQSGASDRSRSWVFRRSKSTGLVMNSAAPYSPARRRRSSSP